MYRCGICRVKWKCGSTVKRFLNTGYDYDLVVIGGGSGGLACAKEAGSLGKKVLLLDYVTPTPHGTKWGLGGTCVNVGCIPKKLFHHGSLLSEFMADSKHYGWIIPNNINHDWKTLQHNISQYIKSLNWGYRMQLNKLEIKYVNAKASFVDSHTVLAVGDKETVQYTGNNFVIAVGGRPNYPDIPGAKEFGITSDDIFYLGKSPGKTLVVGASYVALECAGFLTGLGYDTTLMVRSIFLRGFDQQMAEIVAKNLEVRGTRIQLHCVPVEIRKQEDGKLEVRWKDKNNKEAKELFDTVLFATGRRAQTDDLNLEKIGVELHPNTRKVVGNYEQSSVPHIYAVGDCLQDKPELTPVAIKAGKLLACRLFGNSKLQMDYANIPTTIFTPVEYGCVGLSEEQAIKLHKEDNIEIYHAYYEPLEVDIKNAVTVRTSEEKSVYYIKVICTRTLPHKVVSLHVIGPNAGEIVQGFAAAIKCGLTKEILEETVGIHPTSAEEVVKLRITKRSGEDPRVTGC